MAKKPMVPQSQSQRDRFIETARALGSDEDEAHFKAKLAAIARQKPKGQPSEENSEKENNA